MSIISPAPSTTGAQLRTTVVFDEIRQSIITGEYRPGERLIEAELAEKLDASRTPIREALQRLHAAGLVASHRRGWVVNAFTAVEIRQIYELRMAVEGFASRLAARNRTANDARRLAEIVAIYGTAVDKEDLVACETTNEKLHDLIYAMADNPKLTSRIVEARDHYFTVRLARLFRPEELAEGHRGHVAILRAIERADEPAAEEAARNHLAATMRIAIRHAS